MKDTDKMPFGKYKDQPMVNVPGSYLIWLYDNGKCYGDLKKYIEDNMDVFKKEAKK